MSIFSNIIKGRNPTGGQGNRSTANAAAKAARGDPNEAGNLSSSLKQTDTDAGGLGGVQRRISSVFSGGSQLPEQNAESEEARTNRRGARSITDGLRNRRIAGRFGVGGIGGRSAF